MNFVTLEDHLFGLGHQSGEVVLIALGHRQKKIKLELHLLLKYQPALLMFGERDGWRLFEEKLESALTCGVVVNRTR